MDKENKNNTDSTSSSYDSFWQATKPIIGIFVVGFGVIFGISFFSNTDNLGSVNQINNNNPYSYTTIDRNCSDFDSQIEAQLFFEANGGPNNDPHDLDRDNDGIACEWNP